MISVQFQLPSDYSKGWWKIKVQAGFQIEERSLLVERWFTSRFDVEISSPPFIEVEEQVLPVQIAANYTNYLPVHANASLRVQIKPQVGSQFQGKLSKSGILINTNYN